ncbi:major facilitator superfamily domain-containing protein [Biscogniauxia marginata]|nr:major facilitator superfamily domain-containing protein [Biscogniauxia marginata]
MSEGFEMQRPREGDLKAQDDSSVSKDTAETREEQIIDPEDEVKGTKLILIHTAVCLVNFFGRTGRFIITCYIRSITTEFNSIKDICWYGAAFQVALCASQPLAGKTFVLFSKKLAFLAYLAVFEAGSLLCALAPSSNALIVGRAIAGLGASGTFTGGFTILTTMIPLHRRAIYIGTWSSVFGISSIVGPVIGGALTQHVTWRWCFYINLPISGFAAAIFILLAHFKPAETEKVSLRDKLKALDAVGFVLFAGAITMLLFALHWGGVDFAWKSSTIIGLFVGFAVTISLFILWQLYMQDTALILPRLFKGGRNVWLLCTTVLGSTPTQSGINYLPTVISDVLASFIGSAIVMQLGYWNLFLLVAEAFIFGGIGYSLASTLAHLGMQALLPKELVPIGAATLLMVISTSCSIFLAMGQTVFQGALRANLASVVPPDVIESIISVGATNVGSVVDTPALSAVIRAYGKAVTQVFYIPAGAPVISFILVACCRWIMTKKQPSKDKMTQVS